MRPGQTGWLAAAGDAADLGNQIRKCFENREQTIQMGKQSRQVIETEYQDRREATDYIELYAALLDRRAEDATDSTLSNGSVMRRPHITS